MSFPKKHHFLPLTLLRNFTNSDGKFWVCDKRANKSIFLSRPEDVFFKKHLYSTLDDNGEKNPQLEIDFSKLEGVFSVVLKKILKNVRENRLPNLTYEEKKLWDIYFYFQWKRIPEKTNSLMSREQFEDSLNKSIFEYENNYRPLTEEERARFQSKEYRDKLNRNAKIDAIRYLGHEVQGILNDMSLFFVVLKKSNKSFLIGSDPYVRFMRNYGEKLGSKYVQLWLPIAPDIIVAHIPGLNRDLIKMDVDDCWVRLVNINIFKQSNTIASYSRALVESIASSR